MIRDGQFCAAPHPDLLVDNVKAFEGFARLFQPMYAPRPAGADGANMGDPSRG